MRHYVNRMSTEGLKVSTQGNTLTIQPGRVVLPDGEAELRKERTFVFDPQDRRTQVTLGFDRIGRFFIEWPKPEEEPQAEVKFGILTHLVYFDIPAGEVDLSQTIINVVRGGSGS